MGESSESREHSASEIIDVVCDLLRREEMIELSRVAEHLCSTLGVEEYRKQLQSKKLSKYLSEKRDRVRVVDNSVRLATQQDIQEAQQNSAQSITTDPEPVSVPTSNRTRVPRKSQKSRSSRNMDEDIIVPCPHCQHDIIVAKRAIRCGVFRHGVYKATGRPIAPHTKKELCEQLVAEDKVYGCAKPFRIVVDKSSEPWKYTTEVCGYI